MTGAKNSQKFRDKGYFADKQGVAPYWITQVTFNCSSPFWPPLPPAAQHLGCTTPIFHFLIYFLKYLDSESEHSYADHTLLLWEVMLRDYYFLTWTTGRYPKSAVHGPHKTHLFWKTVEEKEKPKPKQILNGESKGSSPVIISALLLVCSHQLYKPYLFK